MRIEAKEVIDQGWSAHTGHHDVGKDKIRPAWHSFECANRILRALGEDDFVSLLEQNGLNQTKHIRLIIDNQDGFLCAEIVCAVTHDSTKISQATGSQQPDAGLNRTLGETFVRDAVAKIRKESGVCGMRNQSRGRVVHHY
jgi:hypothetical protein